MDKEDLCRHFLKVLRKEAGRIDLTPDTKSYLCQFFHQLFRDCFERAKLKLDDLGVTAAELDLLRQGEKTASPAPKTKRVRAKRADRGK